MRNGSNGAGNSVFTVCTSPSIFRAKTELYIYSFVSKEFGMHFAMIYFYNTNHVSPLSLFFHSIYLPLSNFIVFNTDNNLPNWKRLFEYYMFEFIIKNNVIRVLYNNKWVVPLFSHPFIISNRLYIHLFINKNWITNVLHYKLNSVIMLRCGSCVIHEFVHTHAHTLGIRMEIIHRQKRTTIYFSFKFNLEQ